jgi:hypothetical protein
MTVFCAVWTLSDVQALVHDTKGTDYDKEVQSLLRLFTAYVCILHFVKRVTFGHNQPFSLK